MTCLLAIAPLAAFGDEARPAPTAADAALAQVREQVADVNEEAREDAPVAVGQGCNATLEVEGIGDTCATPDGLLRVEQRDGRSHTIHGLDAPPSESGAFAPGSSAAVSGADASDIQCVGADAPRYVLVYARPGNVASRYSTIAPRLRSEAYRVSAYIDSESRSVDPTASKQLPMQCAGGVPVVLDAALTTLSAGSASFGDVVDALVAKGYEFNGDRTNTLRYIVYYDAASPSGAAGTGHVFTGDSSAGSSNQNNKGGLYAIEYRYAGGSGLPHWEVLIHEVLHTMGAVVNDAGRSSGAGHCTDGQDIMCYVDGSGAPYNASVCGTKVLDCGRNDYFNPRPAAGSYLASHWNSAASYNRYLSHETAVATAGPSAVGSLARSGVSQGAISVRWSAARAASGIARYEIAVRRIGGSWRTVVNTSQLSATVGGLDPSTRYQVGVVTRDKAGRTSTRATVTATTTSRPDHVRPTQPRRVTARQRGSVVNFSWKAARDNVGVSRYELRRVAVSGTRRTLRAAGSTRGTALRVRTNGLRPGKRYVFELVARDAAANRSRPVRVTVTITRDRVRPTAPARLRATARSSRDVTLQWNASRDNSKVRDYHVFQRTSRGWTKLKVMPASKRVLRIVRLERRTRYEFRVQARDDAGNMSSAGRSFTVRTR